MSSWTLTTSKPLSREPISRLLVIRGNAAPENGNGSPETL